ncbi:MAG TPA: hypothetical protein VNL71_00145 [Chloroflexota bacterium]|nr:hypothetical protein [Chloroflexota bacterium]
MNTVMLEPSRHHLAMIPDPLGWPAGAPIHEPADGDGRDPSGRGGWAAA